MLVASSGFGLSLNRTDRVVAILVRCYFFLLSSPRHAHLNELPFISVLDNWKVDFCNKHRIAVEPRHCTLSKVLAVKDIRCSSLIIHRIPLLKESKFQTATSDGILAGCLMFQVYTKS